MARNIEVTLQLDNRKYNQALKQSERQTEQFSDNSKRSLDGLGTAFAALGGAALIQNIVSVGQQFQDLQTSLDFVTGSAGAGAQAFDNLTRLATQTQFGVEELVNAFILLKGSGIEPTNDLLIAFADTASVAQDQIGVLESFVSLFSRAASKGKVELEDLNKIADRGIPIYKVLTDSFKLTIKEIQELAKTPAGQEQLFRGIQQALEDTYGGALQEKLKNSSIAFSNLQIAVRRLSASIFNLGLDNTSAIESLTGAINRLADNGELLKNVFVGIITVLGFVLNPFKKITLAAGALSTAIVALFSRLGPLGKIFTQVTKNAGNFFSVLKSRTKDLFGFGTKTTQNSKSLQKLGQTIDEGASKLGQYGSALALGGAAYVLLDDGTKVTEESQQKLNDAIETGTENLDRATLAAEAFERGYRNAANSAKVLKEEIFDSNDPLSNYQEFLKNILEQSNRSAVEFKFAGQALEFITELYDRGAIATKTYENAVDTLNGILGINTEETEKQKTALELYEEALESLPRTTENYNKLLEQLIELQTTGALKTGEFEKLIRQLDEAFGENEGLYNFLDTLGQAQVALSTDLANAFLEGESAGKAFQNFFKKMVTQIIADILRLQIIQPILGSLFGVNFGAGGSVSGTTGGGLLGALSNLIPGRATGGPVMKSQPYIVGEKGPELFVPHSSGQIVPNNAMGGRTSVTYNINAVDARSFQQLVASDPEFIYNVTRVGARRQPG